VDPYSGDFATFDGRRSVSAIQPFEKLRRKNCTEKKVAQRRLLPPLQQQFFPHDFLLNFLHDFMRDFLHDFLRNYLRNLESGSFIRSFYGTVSQSAAAAGGVGQQRQH